jgi:hypothetical protein
MSNKTIALHDINTSQHVLNETYLVGSNQWGEDVTIVLNTIELLEWLDIPRMKEQSCKYINQINE